MPATHPLRAIRAMVNNAISQLEVLFACMYEDASKGCRPSIAPQKLLRALLLQVLSSVRLERRKQWDGRPHPQLNELAKVAVSPTT